MNARLMIIIFVLFTACLLFAQVGSPAPDFQLNSLAHGTISLSQFSGKVVYIFFFGYS